MPEWLSSWVARLLGNEPVVKIMYSIIVWVCLIVLIPDWVAEKIQIRSGLVYAYQIVVFCLAFTLVDITHRIGKSIKNSINCWREDFQIQVEEKNKENAHKAFIQLLSELDSDDDLLLSMMVEQGNNYVYLVRGDSRSVSLCQKGILVNHGPSSLNPREDTLILNDIFQPVVYKFYSGFFTD